MMIDLEELAGGIAARLGEAQLTPVIEKEIVHYEIISSLKRNGLLQDITFQGGTSLRYTPELVFQADDSIDKGTHILKLLNDIERKETGGDQ